MTLTIFLSSPHFVSTHRRRGSSTAAEGTTYSHEVLPSNPVSWRLSGHEYKVY